MKHFNRLPALAGLLTVAVCLGGLWPTAANEAQAQTYYGRGRSHSPYSGYGAGYNNGYGVRNYGYTGYGNGPYGYGSTSQYAYPSYGGSGYGNGYNGYSSYGYGSSFGFSFGGTPSVGFSYRQNYSPYNSGYYNPYGNWGY